MTHSSVRILRCAVIALGMGCLVASVGAQTDLTVSHIEVTQGVQTNDGTNTHPLVEGRETVVRVYIDSTLAYEPNVNASITLTNGVDSFAFLTPLNPNITANGGLNQDDWQFTSNFCFEAPGGAWDIRAEVNPSSLGSARRPETDYGNNVTTTSVEFQCPTDLSVAYVRVNYAGRGLPNQNFVRAGVADDFLIAAYPLTRLDYYDHGDSMTFATTVDSYSFGETYARGVLKASLAARYIVSSPRPDHLVAFLEGSTSPITGCSTPIGPCNSFLSGESLRALWVGGNPSLYKQVVAHEIGHNLLGWCHNNGDSLISGVDVYGLLDTERIRDRNLDQLMHQTSFGNDMHWPNGDEWDSIYAHEDIQCSALPPAESPDSGVGIESTLVTGLYYPDTETGEILDVFEIDHLPASDDDPTGLLKLELWSGGSVITELNFYPVWPMDCDPPGDCPNGTMEVVPFAVVLDNRGGRMKLVHNPSGATLEDRVRSLSEPAGAFTTVGSGSTLSDGMDIAWTAMDLDGDNLRFLLRWSPDSGATWICMNTIMDDTTWSFASDSNPDCDPGDGVLQLYISDGFNTELVEATGLLHDNPRPPDVTIRGPTTGTHVPEGANLHLRAFAYDALDRVLSSSIEWSSDRDGPLGTGAVIEVEDLAAGRHVICAEATDSDGLTGTDCITLHVTPAFYPPADAPLHLNEIYIAQDGADDHEFIEIIGQPGTSIAGHFVLIVDGGGPNPGTLIAAHALGMGLLPADGYLVVGDAGVANLDTPLTGPSNIPDFSLSFYLIEANDPPSLVAMVGTDLDIDDDGELGTSIASLGNVLDTVSVRGAEPNDLSYILPVLGPEGAIAPHGIFRTCDYPANWNFQEFLNPDPSATEGNLDTPGAPNAGCPACAADLNGDGVGNGVDVGLFLQAYSTGDLAADMNDDGVLNGIDVGLFLQAYFEGC